MTPKELVEKANAAVRELSEAPRVKLTVAVPLPILLAVMQGATRGTLALAGVAKRGRKMLAVADTVITAIERNVASAEEISKEL